MTDDELIEEIRRAAGWGMSRYTARAILAVVAPEIGRRAAAIIEGCIEGSGACGRDYLEGVRDCVLDAFPAPETRPDTDPLRETF